MNAAFWESGENHIAVNPAAAEAADGLAEFATGQGMRGMCFFQTSGSEGVPKWVGLTKAAFLISAQAVNAHFEVTAEDHWLIALPVHHVGGFSMQARAHLAGCRVMLVEGKWNPQEFARQCGKEGITLTSLVPTQVHDLVHERVACPEALRAVIVGGGGMTQWLADAAMALGWRVYQSYGMTEAASQIATQPYNTFGAVFDVTSLEVLPHWDVAADAAGHLVLRGPALARGYARRGNEGAWSWEEIDAEAGLRTRDLVRLWDHGTRRFLAFAGREAGAVKILGELVHLDPLQARLEQMAQQAGWARLPVIVALPDARREARLVLAAETGAGDAEVLRAGFNATIISLCHLDAAIVVSAIPRTSLGKTDMPALTRLLRVAD